MKKRISVFIVFASFALSSVGAIARPVWTSADSRACRISFKKAYIQSSGGSIPPNAMVNEYCNCAEVAYKSGDTMSAVTSLCTNMITNKYSR